MRHDNPADRLLAILEEGMRYKRDTNCRNVWQALLGVQDNNSLLLSRIGRLMELPGEIISSLKECYPEQGNTWSHWESQVNTAFMQQNLNGQWQGFIGQIDDQSINTLRLTSSLLELKSKIKNIPEEDLDKFKSTLLDLMDQVLQSDIDFELKKYLVRSIRRLINSIEEYKLTGAVAICDAIESTVGHAWLSPAFGEFLKTTDLGKKFASTLSVMADAITVATPLIPAIANFVSGLLESVAK